MGTMTITSKIKKIKILTTNLKRKVDTRMEKERVKNAERKVNEIKYLDKRLRELKREGKTQAKREKVAELEKKLTTKGRFLTDVQSGLVKLSKTVNKEMKKKKRKSSGNFWI